ncbi:uncharacterized protein ACIBXB_009865 isoform 2-T2 [Morphnus guianensis]
MQEDKGANEARGFQALSPSPLLVSLKSARSQGGVKSVELIREGPCVCRGGVQTGRAEADGPSSWKGSVYLGDMRGIQAVQRECEKDTIP